MTENQAPDPAHTPGPWSVVKYGTHGGFKVMAGSMPVATVARANTDDEANARLIAAAPELLAFAQSLIADYRSDDGLASAKHIVKLAQEVVTKATGGAA